MEKSKFNLTGLLNQRSMELAQEQAGAAEETKEAGRQEGCLLYTSPSPRD